MTARSPFKEATAKDNKYKLLISHNLENIDFVCKEFWDLVNSNNGKSLRSNTVVTDEKVQNLIENMIKCNPKDRITIDIIEKHDWYCDTTNNGILDDNQLYGVMSERYNTTKENKLRVHKEKENNKHSKSNDKQDIIDQQTTFVAFGSAVSRFSLEYDIDTNRSTLAAQESKWNPDLEASLLTIDEQKEVDNDNNNHNDQMQSKQKGISFVESMTRYISTPNVSLGGNGIYLGDLGGDASKLSEFMSFKVSSAIESWQSIKCYTICNPLVVMVGIGEYHDELQNLIGVIQDYKNMIYTFNNMYNYSFYYQTKDNKMVYTGNTIVNLKNVHISDIIKIDWGADEILDFFESARDMIVSKKHDSLIVIISSHGDSDGIILDSEFEEVQLYQIFYKFMRNECPYLQDKAKIVFVDACRGSLKSWVTDPDLKKQTNVFKGKHDSNDTKESKHNSNSDSNNSNENKANSDCKNEVKSKLYKKIQILVILYCKLIKKHKV